MDESIALVADCINRAHKATKGVVIVIENMVSLHLLQSELDTQVRICTQAGSGNVIGSRFSDLGGIVKQVDDKTRVGVCLDTCECAFLSQSRGTLALGLGSLW